STISVFKDFSTPHMDESYPVGTVEDETVEVIDGSTYGPLKALCEQAAERAMPSRTLTIRPGLIVGPHDPTDRFTYWPHRIAQGGQVIAPGRPDRPIQIIDVRDLAEWAIRMVETKQTGMYNTTGPDYMLTMYNVLSESRKVSGSNARFLWLPEKFLMEQGAVPSPQA